MFTTTQYIGFMAYPRNEYGASLLMHFNEPDDYTDYCNPARVFTLEGAASTQTTEKKFGTSALQCFYYPPGYISTPIDDDVFNFGGKDFTIEGWVYGMGLAGAPTYIQVPLLSVFTNPHGYEFGLINNPGSLRTAYFRNVSGTATTYTFQVSFDIDNRWVYIKAMRKGTSFYLQIDDEISSDFGDIGTVYYPSTGDMLIGKGAHSSWGLDSYIDELRVTNGYGRPMTTKPASEFQDYCIT